LRAKLKTGTEGLTIIPIYAYPDFMCICHFCESYFLQNSFVHVKVALAEIFRETESLWNINGKMDSFQQGIICFSGFRGYWFRSAQSTLPLPLQSTFKQTHVPHLKTNL